MNSKIIPVINLLLITAFAGVSTVTATAANSLTTTGSLNDRRGSHTATLLNNGKVLVTGGFVTGGGLSSCELYESTNGAWSFTGSLTNARYLHTATLLTNGMVLVAGGFSSSAGAPIATAELYNPSTGTWTPTGSMSVPRLNFSICAVPGGKVLATGGYTDGGSYHPEVELYDIFSGTWTNIGNASVARSHHRSILLPNGKVLIAAGAILNGYTETAELFTDLSFCSPHAAHATAQVVNGFVVGATITDGGCGYTNPPVVLIQGGNGTGATAVATIEGGVVVGITITSAGTGYTATPQFAIASPPFTPTLNIQVSKVKVIQHVVIGLKYVLEASTDLVTWSQVGSAFTADSESIAQEFDVAQIGRYFRIHQAP